MVTANRKKLARRAVNCFLNQTYPNKELVIVDDGKEDYSELFAGLPEEDVLYIKMKKEPGMVLGTLRNIALEKARGDFLIQWDDDDWYHPERIAIQAEVLQNGSDACCLSSSMMHLDDPEFINLPFSGSLPDGIPGSIMHVKSDGIRYPEYKKAEDTVYLKEWMERNYVKLPAEYGYLFIRCYHGTNTWEQAHFRRRVKNSFFKVLRFHWYKHIVGDLSRHPDFKMSGKHKETFDSYMAESKKFDLL